MCVQLALCLVDGTERSAIVTETDVFLPEGGSVHMLWLFLLLFVGKLICCFPLRNYSGERDGLGRHILPTSGNQTGQARGEEGRGASSI